VFPFDFFYPGTESSSAFLANSKAPDGLIGRFGFLSI
jgi:hypothetical protein